MDTEEEIIEIIRYGGMAESVELPSARLLPILQAYLDKCQEVERLKGLLSQANGFVRTYGEGPYYEGQDAVVKLTIAIDEALKDKQ